MFRSWLYCVLLAADGPVLIVALVVIPVGFDAWYYPATPEPKAPRLASVAHDMMVSFDSHPMHVEGEFALVEGHMNRSWRAWLTARVGCYLDREWDMDPRESGSSPANAEYDREFRGLYCFHNGPEPDFMGITGEGTFFSVFPRIRFAEMPPDLVLFFEVRGTRGHWMDRYDVALEELAEDNPLAGKNWRKAEGDFVVCFADGKVWTLSAATPLGLIGKLATLTGAAEHDRDELLGEYRVAEYAPR